MSFYKELSAVYDIIFPKDKVTLEFLVVNLKEKSKVLDLACGTGTYAIAIGEKGHEVIGVDLDEAMIGLAKDKTSYDNVHFYEANMLELHKIIKDETFDLIYCIGNSLVHLNDIEKIEKFACDIYSRLENQGEFIVQIINYDRILINDIKELPTIDRSQQGIKFVRKYRVAEEEKIINFDTELIISKTLSVERYENSVPLLPLKSNELLRILMKAGFSKIGIHGAFSNQELNADSYSVVMRAVK
ncbi:MAG: class I SAM-dependent methyltransferase [Clostridiaceae bacterium]|nr:class I SAM-dependent methyltransferase [Clostridiaceae bacterium]